MRIRPTIGMSAVASFGATYGSLHLKATDNAGNVDQLNVNNFSVIGLGAAEFNCGDWRCLDWRDILTY
jgi:hypothetical protein